MPADNDLDPLDAWLQRDIEPLAPPAGTFEAVSRRARRRKAGKLVAAASSAAAVVAVAFAVPMIAAARPSPATNVSAGRSQATVRPAPSPRHSAGPASTPTPTATQSGQANGAASAALPPSFRPASATFVSASHGWVLGYSTSGGITCGTGTCVSIVATADGGQAWTSAPAPDVNFYNGTSGVSSLRYLDGTNGWAYGPDLWSTHDGGQTWTQVSTGGKVVVDLETSDGQAFAILASCGTAQASDAITEYGKSCTDFTLESTPAGSDNWAPVGAATSDLTATGTTSVHATAPSITFGGGKGWLLGPDGAVYSGSLSSGAWSRVSSTPCPALAASSDITPSLLYWTGGTTLLDVCGIAGPVTGNAASTPGPKIYTSANGGQAWQLQTAGPTPDAINSVAYTPTAPDIIACAGGLYVRLASTGKWQHVNGTAGGFSFVGTTTPSQGVAVPANQLNEIWMTYDGGLTWQPYSIGS
jgi:hypothetical protein